MARARWWSLGPVFTFERLSRSRRWQGYALRSLFVLALLVVLGTVWVSARDVADPGLTDQLAESGRFFFHALAIMQLALVLVAGPAATAGRSAWTRRGAPWPT